MTSNAQQLVSVVRVMGEEVPRLGLEDTHTLHRVDKFSGPTETDEVVLSGSGEQFLHSRNIGGMQLIRPFFRLTNQQGEAVGWLFVDWETVIFRPMVGVRQGLTQVVGQTDTRFDFVYGELPPAETSLPYEVMYNPGAEDKVDLGDELSRYFWVNAQGQSFAVGHYWTRSLFTQPFGYKRGAAEEGSVGDLVNFHLRFGVPMDPDIAAMPWLDPAPAVEAQVGRVGEPCSCWLHLIRELELQLAGPTVGGPSPAIVQQALEACFEAATKAPRPEFPEFYEYTPTVFRLRWRSDRHACWARGLLFTEYGRVHMNYEDRQSIWDPNAELADFPFTAVPKRLG